MISVSEAQAVIFQHARVLPSREHTIHALPLGAVLAENIQSDLDSPPFDKALMDGYAVRAADLADGRATLTVVEEITAGRMPTRTVGTGEATRIMTGAPMPTGADAVVPIEKTETLDGGRVKIDHRPMKPGTFVLTRGREMRRGETVLAAGTVLRPQELGLLAAVGCTTAWAVPVPRVAVMTTGDEVVEANETPGPGQIRNGNSPMIVAQVTRAGGEARYLGIGRDALDSLRPLIAKGLEADVLVLSGGVSAGKLDLVPEALREAGVVARVHKVAMKPGKPLFFGTRGQTLVFGLPGNPVSSFVCFELFVRPALTKLRGIADPGPHFVNLPLAEDFPYATERPTYHPARLEQAAVGWQVRIVPWFGSPDLRGLARADALVLLPTGDHVHRAGQPLPVLMLDR